METKQAYLDRKDQEIQFLNGHLRPPRVLTPARTVTAIVEQKFRIAAALKAQHALDHWASTETAWAHVSDYSSGPFHFCYDYQRADLNVSGPPIYELLTLLPRNYFQRTIYANSGMAAIAASLAALDRLNRPIQIIALHGSYNEAINLVQHYGRNLRLKLTGNLTQSNWTTGSGKVLWVDCCISSAAFDSVLNSPARSFDIILFDTTGLWVGSGRARRLFNWAINAGVPILLLRSHTKLDSLGVEYGRLGSAVIIGPRKWRLDKDMSLEWISRQIVDVLRLVGGVAIPAHFPPFITNPLYLSLARQRIASMLRNSRYLARTLGAAFPRRRDFMHQLCVAVTPMTDLSRERVSDLAESMCRDLSTLELPLRHAGSFGFDFPAAEWFYDTAQNKHIVRVAAPDLPATLWDGLVAKIVRWWEAHAAPRQTSARRHRNTYRRVISRSPWPQRTGTTRSA